MKTTTQVLVVFALVLGLFSQPGLVLAADVLRFRGHTASAFFSAIDPSGCIVTGGTVFAFENISHSPPVRGSFATDVLIDFFQYDQCTDTGLLSASNRAPAQNVEFHVAGDLNTAMLTATVPMFDNVSNTAFDLTVDLTWTGTTARRHQSDRFIFNSQGCHISLKNDSSYREAVASGTVSDGTTNFTPLPSEQAAIFLAMGGEISHGCE